MSPRVPPLPPPPPPPKIYRGGLFCFQKFFEKVGIFIILKGGRGRRVSQMTRLAKIGCERGDSTLKNRIVYLSVHFLNLARLYSCRILTVLSYLFIRIPNFGVSMVIMLSHRYLPQVNMC